MKVEYIVNAQKFLDKLDRWCNLRITFELEDKTHVTTRCYCIDWEEDVWSLHIKSFNIKNWYSKGAKTYGQVFESCKGSKRNIVYVNTPLMALRLITQDFVPLNAKLIEVEYI